MLLFSESLWTKYSLYTDVPQLNAHDLEFLAFVAQWLVAKCRARIGDAFFEVVV
jgi:hypothetical protein